MKKIITLCLLLTLCFTACLDTEVNEETTTAPVTEEDILELRAFLKENMPSMDGSTSTIPLEAGAKAELLGISHSEANKLVNHTKTHESFERLLNGEVDLILSVPISKEQEAVVKERGFNLKEVPVAMEGFVFAVNIDNPVDTLSSEQIRSIYSGEITNWNEVGGLDEPIVAYQRNKDSGSQNYMVEFMGDVKLMDAPQELIPGFMGAMMDAVSIYDNSRQAIGYSVYSYAAQMYANANQVKFIKVDGIEPSKATFSDKSYPLLSCTYVFYDGDLSVDSAAPRFAQWLASGDGQMCVLENGYVPVADIELPPEYLPYESLGTGKEKPNNYQPAKKYISGYMDALFEFSDEVNDEVYQVTKVSFDSLKDKSAEAKINLWLEQALAEIAPYSPVLSNDEEFKREWREYGLAWGILGNEDVKQDLHVSSNIQNGYLSIMMGYDDVCPYYTESFEIFPENYHYSVCRAAVFDLTDGSRLEEFSDLFYKDVDFLSVVNDNINEYISKYEEIICPESEKITFSGLLGNVDNFSDNFVCLEADNPYFYCATELVYMSESLKDLCVLWEYRDMTDLFEAVNPEEGEFKNGWFYESDVTAYETEDYTAENGVVYTRIVYSRFLSDSEIEKINDDFKVITDKTLAFDGVYNIYIRINENQNMYVASGSRFTFEGGEFYYDRDTLERLTEDHFLKDGWREKAVYESGIPTENEVFAGYLAYDDICTIYYLGDSSWIPVNIPFEYLKEEFIEKY